MKDRDLGIGYGKPARSLADKRLDIIARFSFAIAFLVLMTAIAEKYLLS